MYDSPRDYWTIVDILSAFIRGHAPIKPSEMDSENSEEGEKKMDSRIAIQAAITILGKRKIEKETEELLIDLSNTNLSALNFYDANFSNTNFHNTNLVKAYLVKAKFNNSWLPGADFTNAIFKDAELNRDCLKDANLTKTNLTNADLTAADLFGADLTRANLTNANLTKVDLRTNPDLRKSKLFKAKNWANAILPDDMGDWDEKSQGFVVTDEGNMRKELMKMKEEEEKKKV